MDEMFIDMIGYIMRSSRSSLAVVLPEFSATLRRSERRFPAFERLVAQSDRATTTSGPATLENGQSELLAALELNDSSRYPSAPLTYFGLCGSMHDGTWMHADPIRLEMANDGMRARVDRAWSPEERIVVEKLIANHLDRDNFSWVTIGERAFIRSRSDLAFTSLAPHQLQLSSLRDALPQGRDAAFARRLMTELQMLLHEKLNDAAPNAIWLWGVGAMSSYESRRLPMLFADDPYARGLYHAHSMSERAKKLPRTFDEIFQDKSAERIVIILNNQSVETIERDWFAPMLRALNKGLVDSIELIIGGYRLVANRSMFRRFFTRARNIEVLRAEPS